MAPETLIPSPTGEMTGFGGFYPPFGPISGNNMNSLGPFIQIPFMPYIFINNGIEEDQ